MPGQFRAEVAEGGIAGQLAGDGPPVLILHGGPGLSDDTAPLAAFELPRYPWNRRLGSLTCRNGWHQDL